jgi:prepilin-type N-terminal cleavage/methylation domain-containing protein
MLIKLKNRLRIRRGMTLVELLVVMSIMVTFAAMTAAFYPSISSDNQIAQASNKIQNLLVGARQKARRDSNVTGVRFFPDTNNPSSATQMMLVQKPVDLTGSSLGANMYQPYLSAPNPANSQNPDPTVIQFSTQVWGFPTGEDLIMANDILVDSFTNNSTKIIGKGASINQMLINSNFYNPDIKFATLNYKIIRQPRIVPGEEAIPMPEGYEIFLGANFSGPKVNPNDSSIDVCFEKTGAVYQIDFAANVYIWVHKTGSTKYSEDDAIIGIQRNNGKVAVFPVGLVDFNNATNSNLHDPFKFARDPANEGL